ncbi:ABC transporter substrate-binding protein [Desulforamulus hydrothermalis]|uniref:Extracellular ligand-binding receptor n=1 Tax=Desulforamulus hydrothermalis Lam5 = DSM 18033 TaxID=1121428 RepID=K8EEF6_9FIRM|nr:ABC transporter substrate-binding protein [Desulforamulus hydrothermalis]CCO07171.1 Extracellular ligand-binding receptor [Desulforamulus hydrothermalis Lam5 = DSM 18033]SHG88551.1 amino acid/amide ABC transporter substrate-binding protein, HAAT family [Desulforamulus hydrothermalis Lam5 = DSM 18033]
MKKVRFAALLAVMVMLAVLAAGCGSGGAQQEQKAASANEIVIGGNFELSGNVATFGTAAANGAELYFDEVNAAGGVLNKKIKFVKLDNKSDATEAANVATRLITQDKVAAILGATTSGDTLGFIQVAADNKIPVLTTSATNPDVTVDPNSKQVREYVFRACFIDPFQGTVMANFAIKDLKAKTAVIYVDNNSPYSKGLAQFFKESFTKQGGNILGEEAFVPEDQDFKATLTKIKGLNPDVVYCPGYYEQVGKIVKQGREVGITVPFLGGDGWDSPKLAEIAGAQALNNTYFSNHYSSEQDDPNVKAFVEKYKAKFGQVPDSMAALGYDAAILIVDAIKRSGDGSPEKIKEALKATKDVQAVTGKLSFDENHNPIKGAAILEMKDGKQVYKTYVNP